MNFNLLIEKLLTERVNIININNSVDQTKIVPESKPTPSLLEMEELQKELDLKIKNMKFFLDEIKLNQNFDPLSQEELEEVEILKHQLFVKERQENNSYRIKEIINKARSSKEFQETD